MAIQTLARAVQEAGRDGTGLILAHVDPATIPQLLAILAIGRHHFTPLEAPRADAPQRGMGPPAEEL